MWVAHYVPSLLLRPLTTAQTPLPLLAFFTQLPALIASLLHLFTSSKTGIFHSKALGDKDVGQVSLWTNSLMGSLAVASVVAVVRLLIGRAKAKDAILSAVATLVPFWMDVFVRDDMSIFPAQNRAPVLKPSRSALATHLITLAPLLLSTITYTFSLPRTSTRNTTLLTLPASLTALYFIFEHVLDISPDTKPLVWVLVNTATLYWFRIVERVSLSRGAVPTLRQDVKTVGKGVVGSVGDAQSSLDGTVKNASDKLGYVQGSVVESVRLAGERISGSVDAAKEVVGGAVGAVKDGVTGTTVTTGDAHGAKGPEYAGEGKWKVTRGDVSTAPGQGSVWHIAKALEGL